jgi:hypothetical protein
MAKKKLSKMGDVMHRVEAVVTEMIEDHDLQKGEVMALISRYIDVHFPCAIEEYEDGSNPVEYYGPREGLR